MLCRHFCSLSLIVLLQTPVITYALDAKCGDARETQPIYIYELTKQPSCAEDYDQVAALVSLQGILNRDAPVLYVCNPNYGKPEYWLELLSRDGRWLQGREHRKLPDLDAVYQLARGSLRGAVVWDPDVPATINLATTIAGVEDAVMLSPEMADKYLAKWNLKIVKDLRGMFTGQETGSKKNDAYRWAIREYIDQGRCSPHFLCLYTDSHFDRAPGQTAYLIVRDWAVKNRAFTYDLSPWGDEVPADDPQQPLGTDLATYHLLLSATLNQSAGKQMTEVAGFFNFHKYANMPGHLSTHDPVPTEWETVYLISPYNCYQNTATEFSYNQSFHSHAPRKPLKQTRPTQKRTPENKSYLAFLMADYDSTYPLYSFLPGFWSDPLRGELPLAWGINPNLLETYPDLIAYFYETATPNDHFVADASAAGYMNPNRVDPKHLPLFVEHNQRFYQEADVTISGMVLDWDQPRSDVKDAFAQFSPDGYATIVADLHTGEGRPPVPHVWKGMPIVQLLGADPNSPEFTAGEIYKAVASRPPNEPGFYYFRCVWVPPEKVKASLELFAQKHPEEPFEVVDLVTFFDLFKQHQEQLARDVQIVTRLPQSSAFIEGVRCEMHCRVHNVTSEPLATKFTSSGLNDSSITPAEAVLETGREMEVAVCGRSSGGEVVFRTASDCGSRDSVVPVRYVAAGEIVGDIPQEALLQCVSDMGSDVLPRTTGEQVVNEDGSVCRAAKRGVSATGYLSYGPYAALAPGRYLALFRLKRTGEGSGDVVQVDAGLAGGGAIYASKTLSADELPEGEFRSLALVFEHQQPGGTYESRVFWTGKASVAFDRIMVWKIVD